MRSSVSSLENERLTAFHHIELDRRHQLARLILPVGLVGWYVQTRHINIEANEAKNPQLAWSCSPSFSLLQVLVA